MALSALMAAALCIVAPLSIPIGPVPITLSVLAIMLMPYLSGMRLAVLAVVLYLALGALGLPVFSGFEGGVRTNIVDIVDLHLGVRYRHTDNDPFYQQNKATVALPITTGTQFPIWNSYELVYDETQTVSVLINARVRLRNSLTADLGFAYNSCKPSVEEYAWYRPSTESKLKLTYDLNDKLSFNSSLLYQGGRYAKVWNDGPLAKYPPRFSSEKMKDVFDLSLGADYKVNDQITAFALLDNVACQKYQLYYNYPVTGIQLFAGVKLRF